MKDIPPANDTTRRPHRRRRQKVATRKRPSAFCNFVATVTNQLSLNFSRFFIKIHLASFFSNQNDLCRILASFDPVVVVVVRCKRNKKKAQIDRLQLVKEKNSIQLGCRHFRRHTIRIRKESVESIGLAVLHLIVERRCPLRSHLVYSTCWQCLSLFSLSSFGTRAGLQFLLQLWPSSC